MSSWSSGITPYGRSPGPEGGNGGFELQTNLETEADYTISQDHLYFVVDCRRAMMERNTAGVPHLVDSFGAILRIMKQKIIARDRSSIGIILVGTKTGAHGNTSEHCCEMLPLAVPSAQNIRDLQDLVDDFDSEFPRRFGGHQPDDIKEFSLKEAIWKCSWGFNDKAPKGKQVGQITKRIYVFTNDDDPNAGEGSEGRRTALIQVAKDCSGNDVEISLWAINPSPGVEFNINRAYRDILITDSESTQPQADNAETQSYMQGQSKLKQQQEEEEESEYLLRERVLVATADGFDMNHNNVKAKFWKKRSLYKGFLDFGLRRVIGDGDSIDGSSKCKGSIPGRIAVEFFSDLRIAEKPASTKLYAATNEPVKSTTSYLDIDSGQRVESHEIKTFVSSNNPNMPHIPMTKEELIGLRNVGESAEVIESDRQFAQTLQMQEYQGEEKAAYSKKQAGSETISIFGTNESQSHAATDSPSSVTSQPPTPTPISESISQAQEQKAQILASDTDMTKPVPQTSIFSVKMEVESTPVAASNNINGVGERSHIDATTSGVGGSGVGVDVGGGRGGSGGGTSISSSTITRTSAHEIDNSNNVFSSIEIKYFASQTQIPVENNIQSPFFVFPDENSLQGSTVLFTALLEDLHRKKLAAFVKYNGRDDKREPHLAAMLPQLEIIDSDGNQTQPAGFHLVILPFRNEIRTAPLLPVVEVLQDSLIDAAVAVVKSMPLCKPQHLSAIESSNSSEVQPREFDYQDCEGPGIQHFYSVLQAVALGEEEYSWKREDDRMMPDNTQVEYAAKHVKNFKRVLALPVDAVKTSLGKRPAAGGTGPNSIAGKKARADALDTQAIQAILTEIKDNGDNLKMAALKDILKTMGLVVSGKKDDLIDRIIKGASDMLKERGFKAESV